MEISKLCFQFLYMCYSRMMTRIYGRNYLPDKLKYLQVLLLRMWIFIDIVLATPTEMFHIKFKKGVYTEDGDSKFVRNTGILSTKLQGVISEDNDSW